MAYGSPYSDLNQSIEQNSGSLGTVGSIAVDWLKWSTWRNPFFLKRVGTTGWDPKISKVGGWLNKVLAPDAAQFYEHGNKLQAANRSMFSTSRGNNTIYMDPSGKPVSEHDILKHRKNKRIASAAKLYGVDESEYYNALKKRKLKPRGFISRLLRLTGERQLSPMEKLAGKATKNRVKNLGGLSGMLWGDSATAATRYSATTRIVGRSLYASQAPLLMFDVGKLAFSGFKSIAEIGAQAAQRPTHMRGAGIPRVAGAATMRRRAIMEIHGSEMGPRRLIGNEAKFLHV